MKLSALMLMLDTLLGLIEREMRKPPRPYRRDLIRLGRRLRRANRLYIRLAQNRETRPIKWET